MKPSLNNKYTRMNVLINESEIFICEELDCKLNYLFILILLYITNGKLECYNDLYYFKEIYYLLSYIKNNVY